MSHPKFHLYGLRAAVFASVACPLAIRSDNGVPFASLTLPALTYPFHDRDILVTVTLGSDECRACLVCSPDGRPAR